MIMNYELNKDFINKHLNDDINKLALSKFPDHIDKQFVIRQIQARQILKKKLPSWAENDELIFPKKLSLEQSSSELTALYKKSLLSDVDEMARIAICENQCQSVVMTTLVDLTGGMGVDTAFLSDNFEKTFYVETQAELCEIARHNFNVMNKNIEVVNDNAEHFLTICDEVDCIYLDPARRDEYGRKMVSLHDCSPDMAELQDLIFKRTKNIMVKLSPMLDIDIIRKELKNIKEIHIVAVKNECKELLVILGQQTTDNGQQTSVKASEASTRLIATDLRENWNFTFTEDEESDAQWTLADSIGKYLYEPCVACMKAGCFKLLSQRYGLDKLHRNSHLYTSNELVADFPGRIFEIINVVPFDKKAKKEISSICQQTDSKPTAQNSKLKASVAVRNFPLSAEELRKHLGFKDGDDFHIFGTTMKGEKKVVILTKKN